MTSRDYFSSSLLVFYLFAVLKDSLVLGLCVVLTLTLVESIVSTSFDGSLSRGPPFCVVRAKFDDGSNILPPIMLPFLVIGETVCRRPEFKALPIASPCLDLM